MLEFHNDVMLRLTGRQPSWIAPAVIPAGLDALVRWPELFEDLSEPETRAVRETCSAIWRTGWVAPSRRDVADLVAELRGEIDLSAYMRRTRARYPNYPEDPSPV